MEEARGQGSGEQIADPGGITVALLNPDQHSISRQKMNGSPVSMLRTLGKRTNEIMLTKSVSFLQNLFI